MKALVFRSKDRDPFFNLAWENYFLETVKDEEIILFLYQNKKSVVIGRNQNPWREADLDKMGRDGVELVRRQSGGGAVWHDEGNLNFSFIQKGMPNKDKNFQFILDALKTWHIHATVNKRFDLVIDEAFKFSGNAFRQKRKAFLHHGTLLIASDLIALEYYLSPSPGEWTGSSVLSTPAKVINLQELNPSMTVNGLISSLSSLFLHETMGKSQYLDSTNEKVRQYRNKISSWSWRFGETPPFVYRQEANSFHVKNGLIGKVVFEQTKKTIRPKNCRFSLEGLENKTF